MKKYILKKILSIIPTVIGVSFIVFFLLYMSPGDAAIAIAGADAPPEVINNLRESLGLNRPFIVQYGSFLKNLFTKFDLGNSYITKDPVTTKLLSALPNTLKLTFFSLSLAVVFGVFFGVISAIKKHKFTDNIIMAIGLIALAMPIFWSGLLLILLFSVRLKMFPSSGFSTVKHMVLPGIALGLQSAAIIMRMTRSSMIEVLNEDYIRTARAKGLKESIVIGLHALKNALIPVITTIGLQAGALLGGSVLTETIFSIPGIGRLMVDAVKTKDYPVVLGGVMFISVAYVIISIIADLLYGVVDPKIKAGRK